MPTDHRPVIDTLTIWGANILTANQQVPAAQRAGALLEAIRHVISAELGPVELARILLVEATGELLEHPEAIDHLSAELSDLRQAAERTGIGQPG